MAAAAGDLQRQASSLDSYYTIFTGLDQNHILSAQNSSAGGYSIASVETGTYQANNALRLELADQPAFVDADYVRSHVSAPVQLSALTSAGTLAQDTYVINLPGAENTAPGNDPNTNTLLDVGLNDAFESYLQFDLSAQAGEHVSLAELTLDATFVTSGWTSGANVEVTAHRDLFDLTSASTFDETTLTYNNRPTYFGDWSASYDENFSAPLDASEPTAGLNTFDVSEAIQRATLAGDSNLNGVIDLGTLKSDIESLYMAIHDWDTYVTLYGHRAATETDLLYANDINWDGVVDQEDWSLMMERWGKPLAEFTGDGTVDAADLSRWQANFGDIHGQQNVWFASGDTDGDGDVDAADFTTINSEIGNSDGPQLTPNVTFRLRSDDATNPGLVGFASKENTSYTAPDLQIAHDADIEVTDFSTFGTEFLLRYHVHNESFTNVNAEIYRVPHDETGVTGGTLLMTESISGAIGAREARFPADFSSDATNEDYRLVVKITGTPSTGTETNLADNERQFAGGVFVNIKVGHEAIHVHGGEAAETIQINEDGIQIAGQQSLVFGYGGGDTTFVDDDSVANGLVHVDDHEAGAYEATSGFSNPNNFFTNTWGDDRDSANKSNYAEKNLAIWEFDDLAAGTYLLSTTWQNNLNRTKSAAYRIYDGDSLSRIEFVNQEIAAQSDHLETHSQVPGQQVKFQDLGTPFTITSGTLRVELNNAFDDKVIADAMRLERIDAPTPTVPVYVRGQGGDDFISAANDLSFAITAFGGDGDDTLTGGPQGDTLIGGMGADTLIGNDGVDTMHGAFPIIQEVQAAVLDDGADTIYGDGGNDHFYVDYTGIVRPAGGDIYSLDSEIESVTADSGGATSGITTSSTWNHQLLWQDNHGFGEGWNLSGLDRLEVGSGTTLYWWRSDGHRVTFADVGQLADGGDATASQITLATVDSVQYYKRADKFGNESYYSTDDTTDQNEGLLIRQVDRLGNEIVYSYVDEDSDGKKREIGTITTRRAPDAGQTAHADEVVTFNYATVTGATGKRVTSIDDPQGRTATVTYDSQGRIDSVQIPDDTATANSLDHVFNLAYRDSGASYTSLSQIVDADGHARNYDWVQDSSTWSNNELQVEIGNSNLVDRYFGAPSDIYARWEAKAGIWQGLLPVMMLTDGLDQLAPTATNDGYYIDRANKTTTFEVDANGSVVGVTDPTGRSTSYVNNDAGQPLEVTFTAAGGERVVDESSYSYDADFNLTAATYVDGSTAAWSYDATYSQLTSYTDELGRQTLLTIDGDGNTTKSRIVVGLNDDSSSESDDIVTDYEYAADGLLTRTVELRHDSNGDALNSLVTDYSYTLVEGSTSSGYIGRHLSQVKIFADDPAVTGIAEISGTAATLYEVVDTDADTDSLPDRDAYGNALSVRDAEGRVSTFAHDALNRQTSLLTDDPVAPFQTSGSGSSPNPDRGYYSTVYTLGGLVKHSRQGGEGETPIEDIGGDFGITYNECDCLEDFWILGPDGDETGEGVTYTYNPDHTVSTYVYSYMTKDSYEYGSAQLALRTTTSPDASTTEPSLISTTVNAFDARNLLSGVRDADGDVMRYEYDARGRLVAEVGALGWRVDYAYDSASQLISTTDAEGRTTRYTYDDAGRVASVLAPGQSSASTYEYDTDDNLRKFTDPIGNETEYEYDFRGRLVKEIDANDDETTFDYYDDDRLKSLTDPNGNTTTWEYDGIGRVAMETNELDDIRYFKYDAIDRLTHEYDRNGRLTVYAYDEFGEVDTESWYEFSTAPTIDPLNPELWLLEDWEALADQTPIEVIDYEFDDLRRLVEVKEIGSYEYDFHYDEISRLQLISQDIDGLADTVHIDHDYDFAGKLTSTAITFGGTYDDGNGTGGGTGGSADFVSGGVADYINTFSYDTAGRLASVTQAAQVATGAHAVSEKRVDFGYNRAGQFSRIARYSDVAGASPVANTSYAYDATGRLSELTHYEGEDTGSTLLAGYGYSYDVANRLTEIDFLPSAYADEDVTFTYDARGQIDTADYAGTSGIEEDYNFDANGNRVGNQVIDSTTQTYETTAGTNNQLLDDGTFTYTYDGEGNRTSRTRISTAAADDFITEYEWDHRNRLTKVTFKNNSSQITETVEYRYDFANRLIGRTHDTTPAISNDEHETIYVHDSEQFSQPHAEVTLSHGNTQAVLQFEGTGPNDLTAGDLSNRYLWGPAIDQLLADEQIDWSNSQADGDTLWALTDHLGTVRDLVDDTGAVQNHKSYDAFGNVTAETNAAIDTVFAYTGKLFDDSTNLQNNLYRWYDASIGKWVSEDPIGFEGREHSNAIRYVGNSVFQYIDPDGLDWLDTAANFGAGWGDTLSFGVTDWIRDKAGINGGVDQSSTAYGVGVGVGVVHTTALGGAAGAARAGAKTTATKFGTRINNHFSHFVPNRAGGPRSIFNGNFVSPLHHARTDPWAFRFLPRPLKAQYPLYPATVRMAARVPYVYTGSVIGAGLGTTSGMILLKNEDCKE